MTLKNQKSEQLFNTAKKLIPGGVNSPVRSFKSVNGDPVVIKSAKGSIIEDVDGNQYVDFVKINYNINFSHHYQLFYPTFFLFDFF